MVIWDLYFFMFHNFNLLLLNEIIDLETYPSNPVMVQPTTKTLKRQLTIYESRPLSSFFLSGGNGYEHFKGTALSFLALQSDPAAMRFGCRLDYRKTETGAFYI